MLALLLIPILVSGYIIVNTRYINYFSIHRYEGQYLYLKVIYTGSACCLMALAVALTLKGFFPGFHPVAAVYARFTTSTAEGEIYRGFSSYRLYIWMSLISITAIIVAMTLSALSYSQQFICGRWFIHPLITTRERLNVRKTPTRELAKTYAQLKIAKNNSIEHHLIHMMLLQDPVIITQKDGLIMGGFITAVSEPDEVKNVSSDITLYPIISGFRHSESSTICIDNIYHHHSRPEMQAPTTTSHTLMINAASIAQVVSFASAMVRLAPAPCDRLLAA